MTAQELYEGKCACGHIDTRHDRSQMPGVRGRAAYESDTYPCLDCSSCSDYRMPAA
jgi:hypothetical protein